MFKVLKRIFFIGGIVGINVLLITNIVVLYYKKGIHTSVEEIPKLHTALVFGGGMEKSGAMTDAQTDRVIRAIELYEAGKVQELVMTGDDGANRADEVSAMKAFAIENGVPAVAIRTDPHGYNTYASCYRAKHEYGLDNIVAVSQTFHLSRILYLCNRQGVGTIGLAADLKDYTLVGRLWVAGGREMLARLKAVWQMEVTKPFPEVY